MKNAIQFEIRDESGCFIYPAERFDPLIDEFDEILDRHQTGRLEDKRYLAALDQFIAREPDFIDGHAHLAFAYYAQGKPKKALEAALTGTAIANRLIPERYDQPIEWAYLENRPFLRAMHAAVRAYIRLRRHKEAVEIIDRMLAYNPNDNQGMRYLLGSELLRAGDPVRARIIFNENMDNYPSYCYELALTHLIDGEWVPAATALRLGFCTNGYIAEILCGNSTPRPLPVWHSSNLADTETAVDYINMYGDLWSRDPHRQAFVHWLFNHSKVMVERAAIMECREVLLWERDVDARQQNLTRLQTSLNGIDGRLSAELIVKRPDRQGREIYPWMLAPARPIFRG